MKIICTEEQKRIIVEDLAQSVHCPFQFASKYCKEIDPCAECIEKLIEWEIEDGDSDG